ncbi:lytic murein transglycosylase [Mycobacterium talmoniae]|uniref:lytic transglycosylase domain-containing protein n=1 Tax=Mycobacterium talmoniae TaxID=1858794 RepID=UPI0009F399E8
MRIGGSWGAASALTRGAARAWAAIRQRTTRVTRSPMCGLAVITPLVFVGAVGGGAPRFSPPVRDAAVTPLAAVAPAPADPSGPAVVAVTRPPTSFHVAAAAASAPPPAIVVSSPGMLGIPGMALAAYRNAEQMMATAAPGCGISWNLLAGIGRIESMHANGGATDARGTAVRPIYGPSLDGTLPGNEVIVQSRAPGRVVYARAMGPMQFLPGTWARYASDGDGDGQADPQNLYDATLAAARYLCSGGLNLRDQSQVLTAILRYNNSMPYARNVLGWAAAYATGVVPLDLPPLTGPPPPIGDAHLEHPEGLGPALPLNFNGLPPTDPLARMPLIDLGPSPTAGPYPGWPAQLPGAAPPARSPNCSVICIEPQAPPPAPADPLPPFGAPPAPMPPYAVPPADAPAPAPVGPAAPVPAPVGPAPGPAPGPVN